MAEPRHFPPPWTVEDKDAYFIVRDHSRQDLAYVYAEDKRTSAKPLTRDEARRIAAKMPEASEAVSGGDCSAGERVASQAGLVTIRRTA